MMRRLVHCYRSEGRDADLLKAPRDAALAIDDSFYIRQFL